MKRIDKTLIELFDRFVAKRSEESRASCRKFDRKSRRQILQLAARGVTTVPQLIAALPTLSPNLKHFGIWWLQVVDAPGVEGTLLGMLHDDPSCRAECAAALASLGGARSTREFIRIGKKQLALPKPDRKWLEAVINGLKMLSKFPADAQEVLLQIYERIDLPGWVRGDAGDALGCCSQLYDRRTNFFRRAWSTARNGLHETDIEVQFWSMYVIIVMANKNSDRRRSNARFAVILPRLREIAANDHRLAPGFWWPMSAEAEDAIDVIETGDGRENDAGMRWLGNAARGTVNRD